MSERKPQALANHGKFDEPFHFFIIPILFGNLGCAVYFLFRHPGYGRGWMVVVALALLVLAFKTRIYSLKLQDRVIRLEERLRLSLLLPEPLRGRIPELREDQLVALRFASDAEIPSLVERTLGEKLSRKDIKKLIQNWRPDYFRI